MKKLMATFLSALLILPSSLAAAIHVPAVIDARQLTQRSYLDLLEMDRIPQFSAAELKTVEEQLKKEREAEQARLTRSEDSVADYLRVRSNPCAKRHRGRFRAVLSRVADAACDGNDSEYNRCVNPFPSEGGSTRSKHEQKQQRTPELVPEHAKPGKPALPSEYVRTVLLETASRVRRG